MEREEHQRGDRAQGGGGQAAATSRMSGSSIAGAAPAALLLAAAADHAARAAGLAQAVHIQAFPNAAPAIRDDDLSLARGFAIALTEAVIAALGDAAATGQGADLLAEIVIDPVLMRHCHARAVEWRLCRASPMIGLASAELPEIVQQHVGGENGEIAEAAMALLIAQSRFASDAMAYVLDLADLPAELVSYLTWRAVRACQADRDPLALRAAAERLLIGFDERRGRPLRLARLCHLLAMPGPAEPWDIVRLGPSLTFAMLARASGLDREDIVLMLADGDFARLAVVLRALVIDSDRALALIAALATLAGIAPTALPDPAMFRAIDRDHAAAMVAQWRNGAALARAGLQFHDSAARPA